MSVSKRLRYEVLRRDNHTCRYCGGAAPDVTLTVDHVVPVALGGADDPTNLVAACRDCNSGKSATPPGAALVADVRQDALRWAKAIEEVGRQIAAEEEHREFVREFFYDGWVSRYGNDDALPDGWEYTIDRLNEASRGHVDFELCSSAAAARPRHDPFRYFCGVAWNRVTAIQERALALVEAPPSPVEQAAPYDEGNPWEAVQKAYNEDPWGWAAPWVDHESEDAYNEALERMGEE